MPYFSSSLRLMVSVMAMRALLLRSFSFLKISLRDRVCSLGSTLVKAVSLIGQQLLLSQNPAGTSGFAKAKAAYQDFLTLWKDADPDIPILKQAKAEYAKLE